MPRIQLEPFENIGAAAATANLTTEAIYPNTLEKVVMTLGGGAFTKTMITQLTVKLGTKLIMDVTGDQLVALNQFEGRVQAATILTIPFFNPRARTLAQQYLGAPDFGALAVRKLQIQVKYAGATTPTLSAKADVVAPGLLGPSGNLLTRQLLRTQLTPSGALVRQPQSIDYGQAKGARLRRLHFFSALATSLAIKRDGLLYFEDVPLVDNNAELTEEGWVPQANVYSFVADEDDNADKTLTTIRNDAGGGSFIPQQILLTTSAGGAFDTVSDVFAGLNG